MINDNAAALQHEVLRWDPGVGVAAASTPPASWFTCPDIFQLERRAVFGSSWVAVGRADQATKLIENASTRYLFAMLCLLNHGMTRYTERPASGVRARLLLLRGVGR